MYINPIQIVKITFKSIKLRNFNPKYKINTKTVTMPADINEYGIAISL